MIDLIVQVFREPRIKTHSHLALMLAIARRCGDASGVCFAKHSTLGADARMHPKSITRSLSELEELGLIRKVKPQPTEDGRRQTDRIYLTLGAVTLPPTGEDEGNAALPPGNAPLPGGSHTVTAPGSGKLPQKSPLEESHEEQDARDARELSPIDGVDVPAAVTLIWHMVGDNGRKRSSRPKIEKALAAALKRRPREVAAEDHLKQILVGIRAYLADPDTRKEGGRFEHGAHRTIEGDVWQTFLAGGAPEPAKDDAPDPAIDPAVGTTLEPGPKLQRLWAELASQGMPWDSARGPRPGMPGCRISPEIQREFGFTPWAPEPPADDDSAAFA